MIRVLVADDDALTRSGLRMILSAGGGIEVVAEVPDGRAAVAEAGRVLPDVALVDVRMPGGDGVSAAARLAVLPQPVAVLVLTTYDHDEYVHSALCAGVCGFILKSQPPEEIVAAVRTVAAGGAVLAPSTACRLIDAYRTGQPLRRAGQPGYRGPELTVREREVLALLARGGSTETIARQLAISKTTVNTHTQHILDKLGAGSRLRAVALAREYGLLDPPALA